MFVLNDDMSIYVTRGDFVLFQLQADDDGKNYKFQPGEVVRIKIYGKKDAKNVVLQKDFPVSEVMESVDIYLEKEDTKIGEVISKPKDYWYEIELNPFDDPQTVVGYDEDGPKLFKLFPEGDDIEEHEYTEKDIPLVDAELDMTSSRPVANQAIARAYQNLLAAYEATHAAVAELHVTPQMFGAIGDGVADDTEAIQEALNNHDTVYIPKGTYMIRTSTDDTAEYGEGEGIGVEIPSGRTLILDKDAVLKGIPNQSKRYRVLWATDKANIVIKGGTIECDRTLEDGQHGFGIALRHCENVLIDGVTIKSALGDCINAGCYADSTEGGSECTNITIKNCELYGARRQGLTIGGVDGCLVENCYIHDISGTDPQAGIDIEVNNTEVQINDNIKIYNTKFENNTGYDIVICQNEKTNVLVDKCTMDQLFNENGAVVVNSEIGTLTASSKSVSTNIRSCDIGLLISYADKCLCIASRLAKVQSANNLHISNCYIECEGESIMLHAYETGYLIVENSTIRANGCAYVFSGNKFDISNCVVNIETDDNFERGFYMSDGKVFGCEISIDTVEKPLFAKTSSEGSMRVVGNRILTDFLASVLSGTTDFYIVGNVFCVTPSATFNNETLVHDNITM